MISGIGSSMSFYNNSSLFATNGANSTSGSSSSSSLAQTEQRLFAAIDTNGDGGISQSEFTNFLDQTSAAGGSNPSQAAALFSQMSNGGNSISLQQFESNAGDLVSALHSQTPAGSSSSSSSAVSALLSNLTQSTQSLIAGSAAGIANSTNSTATSNTQNASGGGHHHHGHGGGSLISQFMQQYQAAGATTATSSVLNASA
jgi:hypothetical protein